MDASKLSLLFSNKWRTTLKVTCLECYNKKAIFEEVRKLLFLNKINEIAWMFEKSNIIGTTYYASNKLGFTTVRAVKINKSEM